MKNKTVTNNEPASSIGKAAIESYEENSNINISEISKKKFENSKINIFSSGCSASFSQKNATKSEI